MNDNKTSPPKMTPEQLYEQLMPLQEAKGYFFNPDKNIALAILKELLLLKDKYGYLCCPCRLSAGVREKDSDIICPCVYREADVKEYATCYCGLYVSKDAHKGNCLRKVIPERRPVEKMLV